MSRIPGPTCHDPFCCRLPSRTPGVLGQNDAGYRHENALPGDTPGPLGVNDHSAALASKGKVEVYRYRPPIFASYSSGNNLEKLKEFVGVATRWGLPTKMLSRVLEKCSVGIAPDDGEEEYQRFKMWGIAVGRKFNLHAETMDGIQVLHPGQDGSSQAHQIASIYHESTHAFFDIEGDDETVKPVMAHGETYFTGAPLSAGGVTKDPNRTFQEVAAEYVENRVWGWWTSLEKIKFNMQRGTLDKQLEKIRTFYNGEMSKSLLGEAHWKQNGEDVLNARPISKELKAFLDHTILEDRIPDRFDSVQLFTNLIKSVEPNQIVLSGDVLFDFDKSELRPIAITSLLKAAAIIQSHPHYLCIIAGHTDGKGRKDYNQKLSEQRANSVRAWLAANRVVNQIIAQGFGDTKPIAPNLQQLRSRAFGFKCRLAHPRHVDLDLDISSSMKLGGAGLRYSGSKNKKRARTEAAVPFLCRPVIAPRPRDQQGANIPRLRYVVLAV